MYTTVIALSYRISDLALNGKVRYQLAVPRIGSRRAPASNPCKAGNDWLVTV